MKPLDRRKRLCFHLLLLSLNSYLSSLSFILNTGLTLDLELSRKAIFSQKIKTYIENKEPFSMTEAECFSAGEHKGVKVQDK